MRTIKLTRAEWDEYYKKGWGYTFEDKKFFRVCIFDGPQLVIIVDEVK